MIHDESKENTEKIKALCHQWGGSLFGVADLRSFKKEEILLPPSLIDQLSFGISVGYHLSDAILEGIENQPTPLYFHHYQRVNILLDTIGLIVTSAIQDLGYQAMPIPASQIVDWKTQRGHLSHKHVARAAGLGWIGRNNLLVNEKFGSRIRLVTILTDLPLVIRFPFTKGLRFLSGLPIGLPGRSDQGTAGRFRSPSMLRTIENLCQNPPFQP